MAGKKRKSKRKNTTKHSVQTSNGNSGKQRTNEAENNVIEVDSRSSNSSKAEEMSKSDQDSNIGSTDSRSDENFNEKLMNDLDECIKLVEYAESHRFLDDFIKDVYLGNIHVESAAYTKLNTEDRPELGADSTSSQPERIKMESRTGKSEMVASDGVSMLRKELGESDVKAAETESIVPSINQSTMSFNEFLLERCNSLIGEQLRNPEELPSLRKPEPVLPEKSKSVRRKFSRKRAMLDEKFNLRKKENKKTVEPQVNGSSESSKTLPSSSRNLGTSNVRALPNSEIESPVSMSEGSVTNKVSSSLSRSVISEVSPNTSSPNSLEQGKQIYESFLMEYSLRSLSRYDNATSLSPLGLNLCSIPTLTQGYTVRDSIFYANNYEEHYERKLVDWLALNNLSDEFNPFILNGMLPKIKNYDKNEKGYKIVKNELEAVDLVEKLKSGFENFTSACKIILKEKEKFLKKEKRAINPKSLSKVCVKTKNSVNAKKTIFDTDVYIMNIQNQLNTWNFYNGALVNDLSLVKVKECFPHQTWQTTVYTEEWCYEFYGDIKTIEQASLYCDEFIKSQSEWIPRYRRLFLAMRAIRSVFNRSYLPGGIEPNVLIRKIVLHYFYTFEGMNLLWVEQQFLKNKCHVLVGKLDKWRKEQLISS